MNKKELTQTIEDLENTIDRQRNRIGELIFQVDYLTINYEPYYPENHKFTGKQRLGRFLASLTRRINGI